MAKNHYEQPPTKGKCDLIEGVLMGDKLPHALNRRYQEDYTPSFMIKRFQKIADTSSCIITISKAKKAIQLLQPFSGSTPMNESDRSKILYQVCDKKLVTA